MQVALKTIDSCSTEDKIEEKHSKSVGELLTLFQKKGKFIPTLNNTGFMSTQLDIFSQAFIAFSKNIFGRALEIGTAYGICALNALSQGVHITCNDIEPRHLSILKEIAVKRGHDANLQLMPGAFPDELHFLDNTFDAILISRVLHLFDGNTIERALLTAKKWLKPNGKLFIVADTIYLKNMVQFIPLYEERVRNKERWPGFFKIDNKLISNLSSEWPDFINTLDKNILCRELIRAGFRTEAVHTISRPDFPADRVLDGREGVGAIAVKSSD